LETLFLKQFKLEHLIEKQLAYVPTIFPLLIKKIGFTVLIIITDCVSRFANLLKSLIPNYLFVISGLAVQIRPWAPERSTALIQARKPPIL
jgi:hypothetical protein